MASASSSSGPCHSIEDPLERVGGTLVGAHSRPDCDRCHALQDWFEPFGPGHFPRVGGHHRVAHGFEAGAVDDLDDGLRDGHRHQTGTGNDGSSCGHRDGTAAALGTGDEEQMSE